MIDYFEKIKDFVVVNIPSKEAPGKIYKKIYKKIKREKNKRKVI